MRSRKLRENSEYVIRQNEKKRAYAATEKGKLAARNTDLRTKMGVTLAEVEVVLLAQGEKCAICSRDLSGAKWGEKVCDHDHATRKFRAVLCANCNTALGKFQDNPDTLRKAASYLEKHKLA